MAMGAMKPGSTFQPTPPQGGKGGGKPEMAMAGGNDPSKLGVALAGVKEWVASK